MIKRALTMMAGAALTAGFAVPAQAATWLVTVKEATGVGQFNADKAGVTQVLGGGNLSTASFTYTGDLNFLNTTPQNSTPSGDITSTFFGANVGNITNYAVGTNAAGAVYGSFATLAGYLNSSGSISGYGYGSVYTFTTSDYVPGTILSVTHDDGVSFYTGGVSGGAGGNVTGTRFGTTTAGPTSSITESVTLPSGPNTFTVVYGRENGSPSVLQLAAVPEPASWAMMIMGFGFIGGAMRVRKTKVAFA